MVDVETTGLDPRRDRVIQIAVTQTDDAGRVERSWTTLVDPRRDPGPVHVHGLDAATLAGAPVYAAVAPQVAELVRGRILVAHNADFDWSFLRAEQRRAGLPLPTRTRMCTVDLSRRLRLPVKDKRLATVAAHWGVTQQRAHDAADDTRVLVEVLQHSLALAAERATELPLVPCTGPGGVWQQARRSRTGWKVRRRYYRLRRAYRRLRRRLKEQPSPRL